MMPTTHVAIIVMSNGRYFVRQTKSNLFEIPNGKIQHTDASAMSAAIRIFRETTNARIALNYVSYVTDFIYDKYNVFIFNDTYTSYHWADTNLLKQYIDKLSVNTYLEIIKVDGKYCDLRLNVLSVKLFRYAIAYGHI